jgi:uncharacterized BrkB/YihY/UPF0761 family membrane protein
MVTRRLRDHSAEILKHPARFALRVLKGFRANQGLLLAGAVAYYTLLSLIPLLILLLVALSHVIAEARLLAALSEYLEFVVPGQALALVDELRTFFAHRQLISGALRWSQWHFMVLLPYVFMIFLGFGLLVVTFVSGRLAVMGAHNVTIFGMPHGLGELSNSLLYLTGVVGEILILTAIYLAMPVGLPNVRHALIGGVTAAILWEITRHALVWYYSTLSQIRVVYGTLATAIAALISVEIAAIILLLGAQVIAEYERGVREPVETTPKPLRTDRPGA